MVYGTANGPQHDFGNYLGRCSTLQKQIEHLSCEGSWADSAFATRLSVSKGNDRPGLTLSTGLGGDLMWDGARGFYVSG